MKKAVRCRIAGCNRMTYRDTGICLICEQARRKLWKQVYEQRVIKRGTIK